MPGDFSFEIKDLIADVTAMKSFDRLNIFDRREKGNNGKRDQLADARIVGRVTATKLPSASALGVLM